MTIEEKERTKVMEEEYLGMLIAQEEAYEQEHEQDDHDQWRINGVSPWEL